MRLDVRRWPSFWVGFGLIALSVALPAIAFYFGQLGLPGSMLWRSFYLAPVVCAVAALGIAGARGDASVRRVGLGVLIGVVGLYGVLPILAGLNRHGPSSGQLFSGMKQAALTALIYDADHDLGIPGDRWTDALTPYAKNESVFRIGAYATPTQPDAYMMAMNSNLDLKPFDAVSAPREAVLFFNSRATWRNQADPLVSIHPEGIRQGRNYAAYVDGSVRWRSAGKPLGKSPLNGAYAETNQP